MLLKKKICLLFILPTLGITLCKVVCASGTATARHATYIHTSIMYLYFYYGAMVEMVFVWRRGPRTLPIAAKTEQRGALANVGLRNSVALLPFPRNLIVPTLSSNRRLQYLHIIPCE